MQELITKKKKTALRDQLVDQALDPAFLQSLRKEQIETLIKRLSKEKKTRYRRNHSKTKYGNINRGFTDHELALFFRHCTNQKAMLAFQLMVNLGLRIGEVVRIKLENIDFRARHLYVETEKAGTFDCLYLHPVALKLLVTWIKLHRVTIQLSQGYLLFASQPTSTGPHISPNWLRKEFRIIAAKAGLNASYGTSEERSENKRERRLFRLTTHSFRHHFITKVFKVTQSIYISKKLARHTNIASTQVYIYTAQQDLDSYMMQVFTTTTSIDGPENFAAAVDSHLFIEEDSTWLFD